MQFRVLGPLEVDDGERPPASIGSRNQRAILGLLLLEPGRSVSTDRLVDAVWGEDPPPTATRTLRTYVSRLRHIVGDALATSDAGYRLDASPADIDAHRFADDVRAAVSVTELESALSAWRGSPFGDLTDIAAIGAAARRLDDLRNGARERLAAALLHAGRPDDAVAVAEALVADDPYREAAWGAAVRALTAAARPTEALRTHQRAVAALAGAGLEPSAGLRQAEAEALAGESADARVAVPRPARPAGSIVGRDGDIDKVGALLDQASVVTLVGPGGVGKTRLAVDIAHRLADRFGLGGRVVELAKIVDGGSVAGAIADSLGLTSGGVDAAELLPRAAALDALVVLDNCEHVIDAAAAAVESMVDPGSPLRVLATSRERLGVAGEHSWTVAPLAMLGAGAPATELFRARAQAASPDLDLGHGADDVIARIVARLDGLPLAIEMAAAQVTTMGLGELADTLDERLDVLRAPRRQGEDRHRTLAHVLEWSEALLDDEERELLAAMSVFAGPVPAGDIRGVLGGPGAVDGARALADRSLVTVGRETDETRYGMLHTVRSYARGRRVGGGADGKLLRRHTDWFVDAARDANRLLLSPSERQGHDRFGEMFAELRTVHRQTRVSDPLRAAALSDALHAFAYTRLRSEPIAWAGHVVDALGHAPAAAAAHATVASGLANGGDLDRAQIAAETAVELAGGVGAAPFPHTILSDIALYRGDLERAGAEARHMSDAALALADVYHAVFGICQEAIVLAYGDRREEALHALDAIDVPDEDLAPTIVGWIAYARGEAIADDDPSAAVAALERCTDLGDSVGNPFLAGVARVSTASLLARAGDPGEAVRRFGPIIEYWMRIGNRTHQLTTLRNLVGLLLRVDAPVAAAELLGTLGGESTVPTYGEEAERIATWEAAVRAALGDAEAHRLAEVGRSRRLEVAAQAAVDALGRLTG